MTRIITLFAATLIATTAMATPTVTPAEDEVPVDVTAPTDSETPTRNEDNMSLGQWVKARRSEGLQGQELADAITAERERRTGTVATEQDRKRASKLAAKTQGKGKGKSADKRPRN
jgi:hypothetical protein